MADEEEDPVPPEGARPDRTGPDTPVAEAQLARPDGKTATRAGAARPPSTRSATGSFGGPARNASGSITGGGRMVSSADATITTPEDEKAGGRRCLGDFELVRKIGQGGMGEVWLATQVSLDRPVAVKVLPRALASQENFIERFQREAKAAASLVHPNVIQIYAYGIHEGTPYFAMEYVEGEDLQQRMRAVQQLDVREIVEVMIGVGAALRAAHEKGLIHRDIKPSNVMIDKNGVVKVMDFGLAKATSSGSKNLTHAGLIMGTPNYLSPEQGRGDPLDGRSDLYSLGVVMYELLTGALPFRADTPAGLIFKHVYEPPPSPKEVRPDIPPFLVEVTLKLLEKDPDDRYKGAAEFLADLTEFLDNWDHYTDGGERRPGSGYQSAERVARSNVLSVTSTGLKKKTSERRASRSAEEVKNAVTEEVERKPPPTRVKSEKTATRPVAAPEPAREKPAEASRPKSDSGPLIPALPPPYHQPPSRKSTRPALPVETGGGKGKWVLLLLVALGGGGFALHTYRPDLTGPYVARVRELVAGVGSQSGSNPGWSSQGEVVAFVFSRSLPPGVSVSLRGPATSYELSPGARGSYPKGTYTLVYRRAGYEPAEFSGLSLLPREQGEAGGLYDVHGNEATSLKIEWVAGPQLQQAYTRGRELLEQGEVARALDHLREAVKLDADYAPTPLDPSAGALFEQATKGKPADLTDLQLDAALERARRALDEKRWQQASIELAANGLAERRADAWRDLTARATEGSERGKALVAELERGISRGRFAEAAEKLVRLEADDPENPERGRLKERLEGARRERDRAMDVSQELEAARTRLNDYLEKWGSEDTEARQRLESVEAELKLRGERQRLHTEMEELHKAGSWEQSLALATQLLQRDPDSERAREVQRQARRELKRGEIVAAFQALDAVLVAGEPDKMVLLFDQSAKEWERELACFRRFRDPRLSGQFTESQHLLPSEQIELDESGRVATVTTEWVFGVRVLGEQPRRLRLVQVVKMRHDGTQWLFTAFQIPEGEKPSAPH